MVPVRVHRPTSRSSKSSCSVGCCATAVPANDIQTVTAAARVVHIARMSFLPSTLWWAGASHQASSETGPIVLHGRKSEHWVLLVQQHAQPDKYFRVADMPIFDRITPR